MTASVAFRAAKLLREARAYISTPENWVKGWFGTSNGRSADDRLQEADRVCSLGALGKVAGMREWSPWAMDEAEEAENYLRNAMGGIGVASFNDHPATRHSDVLAAFDLAIEEACKVVRQEVEKDQ